MKMSWGNNLVLGVEEIDSEHKQLIIHANELFESFSNGTSDDKVIEILQFLTNYVVKHFDHEEKLQKKYGYPDYEAHHQIHEEFKSVVAGIIREVNAGPLLPSLKMRINRITIEWLKDHIGKEDRKVAQFILSKRKA